MNQPAPRKKTRAGKPSRGVIDANRVRKALFVLASICVGACVVISILAIWDYVGNQAAFKFLASCAVLVGGGILFEQLNRAFGSALSAPPEVDLNPSAAGPTGRRQ